ncbi:neocarzinostatin apoprotein domain-containing protein [Microtetraspora malaysiensis]|uniref:neocarzinostatin apoprotein domain-containing protein n=1 Tax=Microtetraspora malaysiensis TaxID=161358 RepID=UPI003D91F565
MLRNRSPRTWLVALAVTFAVTLPLAMGTATAAAKPKLTASQTTDLTSGTEITVTGTGFTPKATLFVALCDTAQPPGKACDTGNFARVKTDGEGRLETTMTPVAVFGGTDCTVTTCALMTNDPANPRDVTDFTQLPLTFAAASSPAPSAAPVESAASGGTSAPAASSAASSATSDEDAGPSVLIIVITVIVILVLAAAVVLFVRRRGAEK